MGFFWQIFRIVCSKACTSRRFYYDIASNIKLKNSLNSAFSLLPGTFRFNWVCKIKSGPLDRNEIVHDSSLGDSLFRSGFAADGVESNRAREQMMGKARHNEGKRILRIPGLYLTVIASQRGFFIEEGYSIVISWWDRLISVTIWMAGVCCRGAAGPLRSPAEFALSTSMKDAEVANRNGRGPSRPPTFT